MAVPDFQTLMRPILQGLEDGEGHSVRDIRTQLVDVFSLTDAELKEMLPSGRVTTFQNRVGWAITYLYRTRLIDRPSRAVYRLNERGRSILAEHPERVDLKSLSQFPEFHEFRQVKPSGPGGSDDASITTGAEHAETPEERLEEAYKELRSALSAELLDRVFDQSAEFFEQLVLDVLHAMGYGGRRDDAAMHMGRTGDEGIDGVIREDRLGLDLIYVQAKRWDKTVDRPEIQKFFGALHGQRATKGVFITTSTFSGGAAEYAEGVTPRIILVDGKELTQLMIEHGVGVTSARTYELKRLDLDYFTSDDEGSLMASEAHRRTLES